MRRQPRSKPLQSLKQREPKALTRHALIDAVTTTAAMFLFAAVGERIKSSLTRLSARNDVYRTGFDAGYDSGYAVGRRIARPVVIPIRRDLIGEGGGR